MRLRCAHITLHQNARDHEEAFSVNVMFAKNAASCKK